MNLSPSYRVTSPNSTLMPSSMPPTPPLLGGAGVDGAIHRVAGPGLMAECKTLNGCPTGEARITGGYDLPWYVIHPPAPSGVAAATARPPNWPPARSCLTLALENGRRTVAFPSISTGVYHYPLMQAAHVALKAITDFLRLHPQPVRHHGLPLFPSPPRLSGGVEYALSGDEAP